MKLHWFLKTKMPVCHIHLEKAEQYLHLKLESNGCGNYNFWMVKCSFSFLYNLKRNASQTCKMNTITKRWKKMKFVFYFAHTLTFWDIILWRIKTNHSNIWTNHIRFTSLFPTLQQDNLAHFQIQSCFRYNCHKLTIYSLHYYGIHGNLWLEWHYFYVRNPFHLIAIL